MRIMTRVELPQGMETAFPRQSDGRVERGAKLPTVQPGLLDSNVVREENRFRCTVGWRPAYTNGQPIRSGWLCPFS